jgi:hypothetical protein
MPDYMAKLEFDDGQQRTIRFFAKNEQVAGEFAAEHFIQSGGTYRMMQLKPDEKNDHDVDIILCWDGVEFVPRELNPITPSKTRKMLGGY